MALQEFSRRMSTARTARTGLIAMLAALALSACASRGAEIPPPPPLKAASAAARAANDPLEPVNRVVFWVNDVLEAVLIRPAARLYQAALPDPVQTGVRNVLTNLRAPLDFTNQALQGDWEQAGIVLRRFVLNSTLGLAGLIDVAERQHGLAYEYESFDQTLAVWGVPEGPYLVLPLLGPSSLRDGPARLAEGLADPVTLYAEARGADTFTYARLGTTVVDTYAGYMPVLDDLRRNSVDYYTAMRSLYRQRRDNWVRDGDSAADAFPDIPDYGD